MWAHVTEHQLLKIRCACGCETKAAAPKEATAPACYGPGCGRSPSISLSTSTSPTTASGDLSDVLPMPVSVGAIKAMVAEAGGGLGLFLESSPTCC